MSKKEYSKAMADNIIEAISTFKTAMEGNGLDVVSIGLSPEHCAQAFFYCTAAFTSTCAQSKHSALSAYKINHTVTQGAILGVEITSVHSSDSSGGAEMSDNYFSRTELLNRVTGVMADLASMGVTLKAVSFCKSTAEEIVQQAEYEGQHRCEKPSARVKHILSHGTINGVKITSPGDGQ